MRCEIRNIFFYTRRVDRKIAQQKALPLKIIICDAKKIYDIFSKGGGVWLDC